MQSVSKVRVLIIDDFDMTRALLKVILRSDEFDLVGEAENGVDGLSLFQKLRPDIVLLDLFMPGMSGLEVLKRIRQLDKRVLVLMVTGANEESFIQDAISLGADAFVVKPFNSSSVLETMDHARKTFILRSAATFR